MKKFLDVNGVKVILSIIDEKIQAIDIPDLNQFIKAEDLEDYVTNEDLQIVEDRIPTIWTGSKSEYQLIDSKDPNTLYLIEEE